MTWVAALLGVALQSYPAATADGSIKYAEDGFSAKFPNRPMFTDFAGMQNQDIAYVHHYQAITDVKLFSVYVVRLRSAARDARDDEELLDTALPSFVGGDCDAGELRAIDAAGGVQHEVTASCPNEFVIRSRFVIAGEFLYVVEVSGGPGFPSGREATRFLDSFRLTADGPAE